METTFTIQSQTHMDAIKRKSILDKLLEVTHMDYETWVTILFENGCNLVENLIRTDEIKRGLLQNPNLKFWDWWFIYSTTDDESIALHGLAFNPACYKKEKQRLIKMSVTREKFESYLTQIFKYAKV
ncbi:MAG: hypothetical protein JSR97_12350 [Verrucomicrobia bacterium]|nr:hypothetical protein [Verrucomicrobiota bacterium]